MAEQPLHGDDIDALSPKEVGRERVAQDVGGDVGDAGERLVSRDDAPYGGRGAGLTSASRKERLATGGASLEVRGEDAPRVHVERDRALTESFAANVDAALALADGEVLELELHELVLANAGAEEEFADGLLAESPVLPNGAQEAPQVRDGEGLADGNFNGGQREVDDGRGPAVAGSDEEGEEVGEASAPTIEGRGLLPRAARGREEGAHIGRANPGRKVGALLRGEEGEEGPNVAQLGAGGVGRPARLHQFRAEQLQHLRSR
ncbi:hypothetical protein ASNO1_00030 [Corallococcus caeni]|uniref:Uncharacterized protein n=1 Tax=Corallococcus caeni TaxID=3082388 RepID=A0ABQ6QJ65_9BACT|nr:hypothetical protein ASNO1_00030 [Corallococcus sp. NO1]